MVIISSFKSQFKTSAMAGLNKKGFVEKIYVWKTFLVLFYQGKKQQGNHILTACSQACAISCAPARVGCTPSIVQ